MTPMNGMPPTSAYSSGSPAMLNKVSSMGQPKAESTDQGEQEPVGNNVQSEKLTNRFSILFKMFSELSSDFPGGEEEVKNVQSALANWLNKSAQSLNDSNNGGNS